MGSKEFKVASVLGLLLTLTTSCATVNYNYGKNPCQILETKDGGKTVILQCPAAPIQREPREHHGRER